jgi:hypothetical protein
MTTQKQKTGILSSSGAELEEGDIVLENFKEPLTHFEVVLEAEGFFLKNTNTRELKVLDEKSYQAKSDKLIFIKKSY